MKYLKKIALLLGLCALCFSAQATGYKERVGVMKYAVKQEAKYPLSLELKTSWMPFLNLIEEAHAYAENDACLVLGYKSTFSKGVCRLANAEGVGEYKAQCKGGTLPCNPQVFGMPAEGKPFCVSRTSGKELSKYCAFQSFQHVAKSSPKVQALIADKSASSFDLDSIQFPANDEEVSKAFQEVFSHKGSTIDDATTFMKGLCEDLKGSTATGHQASDVQMCEGYVKSLESVKGVVAKPDDVKTDEEGHEEGHSEGVDRAPTPGASEQPSPGTVEQEECEDNKGPLDSRSEGNVDELGSVAIKAAGRAIYKCMDQLEEKLKTLRETEDGFAPYIHDLKGQKTFGIFCLDEHLAEQRAEKRFLFLTDEGIKQFQIPFTYPVPKDVVPGVNKIETNGAKYFVVEDIFNAIKLVPADKVSSESEKVSKAINNYTKSEPNAATHPLKEVPYTDYNEVKSCLDRRFGTALSILAKEEMRQFPTADVYNQQIKMDRADAALNAKYAKTVDQIKSDAYKKFGDSLPECDGIVTEEILGKLIDKEESEPIDLYNKMRKHLGK